MQQQDLDLKACVIAAQLGANGNDSDKVVIVYTGGAKRSFRTDVEGIEEIVGVYNTDYTFVLTPRDGLYDLLPEGLFHSPGVNTQWKDVKASVLAMKQRREEERNARLFFMPFEAAIQHSYVEMALFENVLYSAAYTDMLKHTFAKLWPVLTYLNNDQVKIFFTALPTLHLMRDDHAKIESFLSAIFKIDIRVSMSYTLKEMQLEKGASFGTHLGIDSTTAFSKVNGDPVIILSIGPVDIQTQQNFVNDQAGAHTLEMLTDMLFPAELEVQTNISLHPQNRRLRFASRENSFNSSLGMDTFL